MVRLWSTILGWLGFGPSAQALAAPVIPESLEDASETAWEQERETPTPEVEESFIPDQAWWRCPEPTILEAPRITLDDNPADMSLVKELQAFIESPEVELPHLPHIPQLVLAQVRQVNTNYPAISKVLSQDQTLAACILRQANSAAYAGHSEVTNLEVALSRLGMKQIRNVMLKESVKSITIRQTAGGKSVAEVIWKRAVSSAVIMEHLAMLYRLKPDETYLMGLLHDIGELVLLRAVHDYQRLTKQKIPPQVFDYVCQELHERRGGTLADHWKMPAPIKAVMQKHHGTITANEPYAREKCLLQVSDMLTSFMGYGIKYPYNLLEHPSARMIAFGQDRNHIDVLSYLPELVRIEMNLAL